MINPPLFHKNESNRLQLNQIKQGNGRQEEGIYSE